MQEASVQGHQRAVLGIETQGSISPFTSVILHLKSRAFCYYIRPCIFAKSGPQSQRTIGIVIVDCAIRSDTAEVIVVVVIRRTKAPPNRPKADFQKYTYEKLFLFCCYIFDCPFQKFVFFVDQFTQVLDHLIQLFHCVL